MLLNQIDKMQHQLDSMEDLTQQHQIDTLHLIILKIRNKIEEVRKYYIPDTIDYEVAEMMNAFKETRKALASNDKNLSKVKTSIPEVRQKLEDLSFDIENGVGSRDKYNEYVDFEKNKVARIADILSYYIKTKDKYLTLFFELDPKIDDFINTIKDEK